VGADPAALKHREASPRECGGARAVLHAVGQDHEEHAGELSQDALKQLIARLKVRKFSHLMFSLHHPFAIELKE